MNQVKKLEKQDILFWVCLFACMGIFFWRCTFSINYYDEPYGIAVIWRFFKGGAILAEDWHPSQQLTAWILWPLYVFLHTILGGNEGIILGFRISYVLLQGVITVYCYYRLRKYHDYPIAAVLLYMFSTHNNMTTINYNTIGIGTLMVLLTTLYTEERNRRYTYYLCGVLFAIMILAQPYSIMMFGVWGIAVCFAKFFRKDCKIPQLLRMSNYFYVCLGAATVLVLFLIIVFFRANIESVITGIYYNLNDPEHQMDLSYKFTKYFERFYRYYKYQILMIGVSIFVGLVKQKKLSKIARCVCLILTTIAFAYTMIYHGWISDYVPIDFISVPMTFYGISLLAISRQKNWKLFFFWIVPALLYTFCVQLATDTGILAVSAATIVASSGGALLAAEFLIEEKKFILKKSYQVLLICFVMVNIMQAGLFLYQRICYTWWSEDVSLCTETVQSGPAKGIKTSKDDLIWYENTLKEIDDLQLTENDRLLILEHASWLYLYADIPVSTYSFWTVGEENYLEEYYELYPGKRPTVVYVSDIDEPKEKRYVKMFQEEGYILKEYDSGNIFLTK